MPSIEKTEAEKTRTIIVYKVEGDKRQDRNGLQHQEQQVGSLLVDEMFPVSEMIETLLWREGVV